jgi:hypothetical protein
MPKFWLPSMSTNKLTFFYVCQYKKLVGVEGADPIRKIF